LYSSLAALLQNDCGNFFGRTWAIVCSIARISEGIPGFN
jgi:hypothetical protein